MTRVGYDDRCPGIGLSSYNHKPRHLAMASGFRGASGVCVLEVDHGRFRHVLLRGNTADPAAMYRAWLGLQPSIQPMLKVRGLLNADS
jgi:hypothetical protein